MNACSIPKATLGRLPRYLQYLKSLPERNGATISATAIARGLSLGDVQVRKATSLLDAFSTAMGMLLAMTGTVCLLLMISVMCFLRGMG